MTPIFHFYGFCQFFYSFKSPALVMESDFYGLNLLQEVSDACFVIHCVLTLANTETSIFFPPRLYQFLVAVFLHRRKIATLRNMQCVSSKAGDERVEKKAGSEGTK